MINPTLFDIWRVQKNYNNQIRAREQGNYEYWMKQYLLGAVSEVDEILGEINWKSHRRGHAMNPHNLARELADLTKYVFSMWEWSGFGAEDMLKYVDEKSAELQNQWEQDFEFNIPVGAPVIITDIDGTLGDWRTAFADWLTREHNVQLPPDLSTHMALEINLGLPYPVYAMYKEQFEAQGGYQELRAYAEAESTLRALWVAGVYIIAYTARPARAHTRIWDDTWKWLSSNRMAAPIRQLRIGHEDRLSRACELAEAGHPVMLLEDDPSLALRAAHTGLKVTMRAQRYNAGVVHTNITRVNSFNADSILESLTKGDPE